MPYNVYVSDLQEGVYTKIAENITEPSINIESPDTAKGGEKFIKVAEVNNAGEGFLSKPVKLTFIGDVPKPEILQYFYNGFFIQYKNAAYATEMNLQASINGGEFVTKDTSQKKESHTVVDNITGPVSFKTVCKGQDSMRNSAVISNITPQNFILASFGTNAILRSTDAGATWSSISIAGGYIPILLTRFRNNICFFTAFAGIGYGGVFRSADGGLSWKLVIPAGSLCNSIVALDNQVFLATARNTSPGSSYLQRSNDNGVSWTRSQVPCESVFTIGGNIVLIGTANGIRRSTDGGFSFSPTSSTSGKYLFFSFSGPDSIIAVGSNIIRSTDGGQTWAVVNYLNTDTVYGSLVCYLGSNITLVAINKKILRSADGGITWGEVLSFKGSFSPSFANLGGGQVLFSYGNTEISSVGVYRSTNYGITWQPFRTGQCTGVC